MVSRPAMQSAFMLGALMSIAGANPSTQPSQLQPERLFVPGPSIPVGSGSASPVARDFNGDGHLDLFTRHLLQKRAAVHLGDGRGHFTSPPDLAAELPWGPGASALADLDADGHLDAIFAHKDERGEFVSVYLGVPTGAFSLHGSAIRTRAAMEYYKPGLFIADVNEDGQPDVLASNARRASIDLLIGDGRGGLAPARAALDLPPVDAGWWFAVGDVDGDRHADVMATASFEDRAGSRFVVARGNGQGSFVIDAALGQTFSAGARLVAAVDVTGDGRLDLIVKTGRSIAVRTNQGNGRFGPASAPIVLPAETFDVVAADANRDRQLDLIAATEDSVTVLVNDRGTFVSAVGSPFAARPGAFAVAVADVNEDGKLDIVASSFGGDRATLLFGN